MPSGTYAGRRLAVILDTLPPSPPHRWSFVHPAPASGAAPIKVNLPFHVKLSHQAGYTIEKASQLARSVKGANCRSDCYQEHSDDQNCHQCSMRLNATVEYTEGEALCHRADLTAKGVCLEVLLRRDTLPTHIAPAGDHGKEGVEDLAKELHDAPSNADSKCYSAAAQGGTG
jgi:hypothetical protein